MKNYLLCLLLYVLPVLLEAAFIPTSHQRTKQHESRLLVQNHESSSSSSSRRNFLSHLAIGTAGTLSSNIIHQPDPANAGEVGARITKAVTQSDLGISVRRSVVRGAQIIDELDGKWEKFSDDNGLGAERFKQQPRPMPREVPDPAPLNGDVAKKVLQFADEAFLKSLNDKNILPSDLESQIQKVDNLVRKSFERSGSDLSQGTAIIAATLTAPQFNYYCYVHFKAMCDIVVQNKLPFNRKKFENILGESLLPLFSPNASELISSIPKQNQAKAIEVGLKIIDDILQNLVRFGFCSIAERNEVEKEDGKIADWLDDLTDLQLSIPLDGDVTLNSQVLLQEQGFRVYPCFGKAVITSALQRCLSETKQSITSDEYYMDTNYSSDPNLFEVKQVLINIVIDS